VERQPSTAQDVSLFDQSLGSAISKDGTSVLLSDQGSIAGTTYATYLRRLDQTEAVRLGDGQAVDLSPDGQWSLSIVYGPPSRLLLLPLGAGRTTELPNTRKMTIQAAGFIDGRRVVFLGRQPDVLLRHQGLARWLARLGARARQPALSRSGLRRAPRVDQGGESGRARHPMVGGRRRRPPACAAPSCR